MKNPYPVCRPCGSQFLVQKVVGAGQLRQRCRSYPLCFEIPCAAQEPVCVTDAQLCGEPQWEEIPCPECGTKLLKVTLPLRLRLRDACGHCFNTDSALTEEVRIRFYESDCLSGQTFMQAQVRFCGNSCACTPGNCVPLTVSIDAYRTTFCPVGSMRPPCPPPKPWYPEPGFDPYCGRCE